MKNFKVTGNNIVNVYHRPDGAAGMWIHQLIQHEEYFETREAALEFAHRNLWDDIKVEHIS